MFPTKVEPTSNFASVLSADSYLLDQSSKLGSGASYAGESLLPFRDVFNYQISELGLNPEEHRIPRAEIRSNYRIWSARAEGYGYTTEMTIGGSLGSELFWGPKPRSHSSNPNCPREFDRIIECDGRVILHSFKNKPVSPHDEAVVNDFSKILGIQNKMKPEIVNRWNRDTEVTRIYTYRDLGKGVGLEFEMCLVPSFFIDPAKYWRFTFTQEERQQQAFFRASLRSLGAEKREISIEKIPENKECRWRVVSAYSLKALLDSGQLEMFSRALPDGYMSQVRAELGGIFSSPPPQLIAPLVKAWLSGENPSSPQFHPDCGLQRPGPDELPASPVKERLGSRYPEVIIQVPPPKYVGLADIVHRALIRARESGTM